ncbi:hypothetical protein AKJ41_02490 [candidate division MSBL1 archaeon SCGC-AAA259O05]|uniref:AN1-type domain-containing protein n=1 Tax=candidate division MSBL1 archaeon SCGC-AAA259O05 TaxID=1698271 RepID=A0A133V406_9EURY|nr:hypothetical protein AKJ41_02490 [candidate division MSBL1 archaeon SCGC-AAA259O05]
MGGRRRLPTCDYCGKEISLPYTCEYCGGSFCSKHRLPEKHECEGLSEISRKSREEGGIYRGISEELRREEPREEAPGEYRIGEHERDRRKRGGIDEIFKSLFKGSLGLLKSFFTRNAAMLILLSMILVFFGQLVAMGVLGSAYYTPSDFGTFLYFLAPSQATVLTRPWTLITSIFVHGGFFHLMINGIVMFFIGLAPERRIGRNKLIYLFLRAGALASLVQLLFIPSSIVILGASGAILGVLGTLTMLAPQMPVPLFFFIPMPLWMLALGYGAFSAVMALSGAGGHIGPMAHFSGLIVGLAYGYKLRRGGKEGHGGTFRPPRGRS